MSEEDKKVFKCPNDFKVTMSKHNGEVVLDEECCTAVSIILKNTGEIATSFFGAHNKDVIKILEKTLKVYFKSIKKTLKTEASMEEEIKVVGGEIPKEDKWNGEAVPDVGDKCTCDKTTPKCKLAGEKSIKTTNTASAKTPKTASHKTPKKKAASKPANNKNTKKSK